MDLDAVAIGLAIKNESRFQKAKELLKNGLLLKRGERAWGFVQDYFKEHGSLPTPSIIKEQTGLRAEAEDEMAMGWVVDQLHERHVFRSLEHGLGLGVEYLEQGDAEKSEEEVHKLSAHLKEQSTQKVRLHTLAEIAPEVAELYESTKRGDTGVKFPWESMTGMTMGMWPGTVTMFVARPSTGKTWTIILISENAAFEQGLTVLLVSPEMTRIDMGERFVTKYGGYNFSDVIAGRLGKFVEPKFHQTINEMKGSEAAQKLYIMDDEEKLAPGYIEDAIDAVDPDLVCIDSAYMLRVEQGRIKDGPGSKGNRQDRMISTVEWMRSTAKSTYKPFCAISQISRLGVLKKKTKETLKKGKGTGGLENALAFTDALFQDCNNLFAMVQDDDMRVDKMMLYVPLKIRRQVFWSTIVTRWDMDEMSFDEIGSKVITEDDDWEDKGHEERKMIF